MEVVDDGEGGQEGSPLSWCGWLTGMYDKMSIGACHGYSGSAVDQVAAPIDEPRVLGGIWNA
jgi:hypothetical protein